MTTAEQIDLLLPWLNDRLPDRAVRRLLHAFLASFRATRIRLPEPGGHDLVADATDEELAATRRKLERLLSSAFWFSDEDEGDHRGTKHLDWEDVRLPLTFPSIRFGAARQVASVKRSALNRRERKALADRGAYQVLIEAGRLRDLVPFLVLQLLAAPGEITISRCPAPAPLNWKQRCGRLFIVAKGVGRPKEFCSRDCTNRRDSVRKEERKQEERKRAHARRRKR